MKKPFACRIAVIALVLALTASRGAMAQVTRSEDFNVFWPQLRQALLEADVDTLDELSLSTSGIPFGYDSLDPANACQRSALQAYLKAKLDFFYARPGGSSWREMLERTPDLDPDAHPEIIRNGIGEYSFGLKVRFARNSVDNAWDVVDMLDDLNRVYSFSESAGGPGGC